MPVAINSLQTNTAVSESANSLLGLVASLETRLAALEAIITTPPGGGVAIVSPTSLKLVVGTNYLISVGADLTLTVGNGATVNVARQLAITAGDQLTLKTGSASLTMKRSGDVTVTGSKIDIKGSGDVVIKGSKVLTN